MMGIIHKTGCSSTIKVPRLFIEYDSKNKTCFELSRFALK